MAFFGSEPDAATSSNFGSTPDQSSGPNFGAQPSVGTAPTSNASVTGVNEVSQEGSVAAEGAYNDADSAVSGYHFVSDLEPGEDYTLEAHRLEDDLDPAMWVFEGNRSFEDFEDSGTLDDGNFTYQTVGHRDFADDEIWFADGPHEDPRSEITAPASGEVTAVVTNFASGNDDGGDGRFDYRLDVTRDNPGEGEADTIELSNPGASSQSGSSFFSDYVTLHFEGIVGPGQADFIPDGYMGFDWVNGGAVDESTHTESGYNNVIQSGRASFLNALARDASITQSEGKSFDLVSGYFAAAWNNDLKVVIEGVRDDEVVGTTEMTLSPDSVEVDFLGGAAPDAVDPTFSGSFNNLDEVLMVSSGGTAAFENLDTDENQHFTMDDLIVLVGQSDGSTAEDGQPFFGADIG